MADPQELIDLIYSAAEKDLAMNRKMADNHIEESQQVIANIAMLKELGGPDPLLVSAAALGAASENPQQPETTS